MKILRKPARSFMSVLVLLLAAVMFAACGDDAVEPEAQVTPTVSPEESANVEEELESALRDAATVEELYFTENLEYTDSVPELIEFGFEPAEGVTVTIPFADQEGFCMEAVHGSSPEQIHSYSSADLEFSDEPC